MCIMGFKQYRAFVPDSDRIELAAAKIGDHTLLTPSERVPRVLLRAHDSGAPGGVRVLSKYEVEAEALQHHGQHGLDFHGGEGRADARAGPGGKGYVGVVGVLRRELTSGCIQHMCFLHPSPFLQPSGRNSYELQPIL